jgi:hypothetical protein
VSANPFGTDTKACEFANLTMIRIGSRGVVPRSNEFGDSVRVLWGEFGFYWCGDEPLVNTWNLEIETKTFRVAPF